MKLFIASLVLLFATKASQAQPVSLSWERTYKGMGQNENNPRAMVVDTNGDVYVTGYSQDTNNSFASSDFATVKYSSSGVPLWTNRYDGPAAGDDKATAMVINSDGDLIVAGSSAGGSSYRDLTTIAYSNQGVPLWTNRFNGAGNFDDSANAATTDTNGNIFVTGSSRETNGYDSMAIIKYSGAGTPIWTNCYAGPSPSQNYGSKIAIDSHGNVFVGGNSYVYPAASAEFALLAYSNEGLPLWTNRYDGPITAYDVASGMAVDPSGNVFITGYSSGDGTGFDFATIKYSGSGLPLWTNRFNGIGNDEDRPAAIAVDANGVAFVTGFSRIINSNFPSVGIPNYATVAYSATGVPLWTNIFDGPAGSYDFATAISLDASGNVYVTGQSDSNGSLKYDYATIKYSNAGTPLWTNRYVAQVNSANIASAIALDAGGNVFVTGYSVTNGTLSQYATIKYSLVQSIPLAIQMSDNQFILDWTNAAFSLQSSPTPHGSFTNIPGATSPHTNSVLGSQTFFRLISN